MTYTVELDNRQRFIVRTPYTEAHVLQRLPDARLWDGKFKVWRVTPSRVNIEHLRKWLPRLTWDDPARCLAEQVMARGTPVPKVVDPGGYQFRTTPFPPWVHQVEAFGMSRDREVFALLMEQRTGKSRVLVDTASDLFLRGKIDLAVVICPNSVKTVWTDPREGEIATWTPDGVPTDVVLYQSHLKARATARMLQPKKGALQWLVINAEALSGSGAQWLREHLVNRRAIGIVDEATHFKRHSTGRTKALLGMRTRFLYRRIATGTLVTQGPLDVFAPMAFLDPAILGYASFYAFRNDFALLGGYNNKEIIGYVNVERLHELTAPFSYRKLREECWPDAPPKLYQKVEVELAPEQRRVYDQMRDTMLAELTTGGLQAQASIVLTQITRLQQISGGFLPVLDPDAEDTLRPAKLQTLAIPGPNAKLVALLEYLEEETGKGIIWSRFRPEIALIAAALRERYGTDAVVEFHGGVKEDQRIVNRQRFQDPASGVRWLVGQQGAGGMGIPLHAANLMAYFSNTHALLDRLQSEDRSQSGTRATSCMYVDFVAKDTVDPKVRATLRGKKNLADIVNGDTAKEWLT